MKKSNLKYVIGILLMLFIDSLHNIFFENNDKYDLYLFYDHERFLTNILFDISNMFRFSLLTFWMSRYNKRIFEPFFWLSVLVWVSYFTTYNQITSLWVLIAYLGIVIHYNRNT